MAQDELRQAFWTNQDAGLKYRQSSKKSRFWKSWPGVRLAG